MAYLILARLQFTQTVLRGIVPSTCDCHGAADQSTCSYCLLLRLSLAMTLPSMCFSVRRCCLRRCFPAWWVAFEGGSVPGVVAFEGGSVPGNVSFEATLFTLHFFQSFTGDPKPRWGLMETSIMAIFPIFYFLCHFLCHAERSRSIHYSLFTVIG